jgi:AraC-like DNA-binding protein
MGASSFESDLSLQLLYAGFYRVGTWWNYDNVISPFSRIYLITKGSGAVYIHKKKYELHPNQLFLIPKFVAHRYECDDFMEHYYICFFDTKTREIDRYERLDMNLQLPSKPIDYALMERFMELNPHKSLPTTDPRKYDNKRNIHFMNKETNSLEYARNIENNGILLQLFSRFITSAQVPLSGINCPYEKFDVVMNYIHNNLSTHISVSGLAELMYVTPDHFSRLFKKIHGVNPCEYIQLKRIEKAQTLMLTSQITIKEIASAVGLPNLSQFSRLFSKHTHHAPREYRAMLFKELKKE